jgi:hypothetical protein
MLLPTGSFIKVLATVRGSNVRGMGVVVAVGVAADEPSAGGTEANTSARPGISGQSIPP